MGPTLEPFSLSLFILTLLSSRCIEMIRNNKLSNLLFFTRNQNSDDMTPSTKGINFIANEYDLKTASLANLCCFKLLCNTVEDVEFPLVLDEKTHFFS